MKFRSLMAVTLGLLVAAPAIAQSSHSVRGYTRKDGTYVAPHRATNPNSTLMDNWSTKGNVNPDTGKAGTKDPYGSSSSSSSSSSSNPYKSPY